MLTPTNLRREELQRAVKLELMGSQAVPGKPGHPRDEHRHWRRDGCHERDDPLHLSPLSLVDGLADVTDRVDLRSSDPVNSRRAVE